MVLLINNGNISTYLALPEPKLHICHSLWARHVFASLCSMLAHKAIIINKSLSQKMLCFNIFGRATGERELWVFSLKKVVLSVVTVVLLSHGVNPTQS